MTTKEYKYYFGCGFAWWALHIFYRPFESAELQELLTVQDGIDDFDEHAEQVGAWLLDEVAKPGLAFEIDSKKLSMFNIITESEPRVKTWMHQLLNVMKAQKIEDRTKQFEYIYCIFIGWELYMIMIAQKFMNNQQPEGEAERNELIHPFANWLLTEWDVACRKFLGMSAEEMMKNDEARLTYEAIAIDWHKAIDEAMNTYLKTEQHDEQ